MADDMAVALLYEEALVNVEMGFIRPSELDLEELERLSDPDFTCRHQYVQLCQRLPGYETIRVRYGEAHHHHHIHSYIAFGFL